MTGFSAANRGTGTAVLASARAARDNEEVAHIIPDPPRAPEFPPKRQWAGLQPTVPAYDDPGFDAARRAWLAWWEFGKAMGFTGDTP